VNQYEAILFDFDGVLIDSEPVHFACWRDVMRSVGVPLTRETYDARLRGHSGSLLLEQLCALRTPPVAFDEMLALYPVKNDLFRDRALHLDLMSAEVMALLDELRGMKLAVVSSARRNHLFPILDRVKLRGRFDTIVTREDVQQLKPAPEPYLLAARRLGVSRALVVEDSEAGAASGRAAGFDVIFVPEYAAMPGLVRERLADGVRFQTLS
jgi:beta-phosphoglucomutase